MGVSQGYRARIQSCSGACGLTLTYSLCSLGSLLQSSLRYSRTSLLLPKYLSTTVTASSQRSASRYFYNKLLLFNIQ